MSPLSMDFPFQLVQKKQILKQFICLLGENVLAFFPNHLTTTRNKNYKKTSQL